MKDRLATMLEMQRDLQLKMPSGDPALLEGDARAAFVTWNVTALADEIHEALAEMGWKPWATSRHLNPDAMLKEMVDAWHFFMNILLVIGAELDLTPEELSANFFRAYTKKNQVNVERQAGGYDGVSTKCPNCKRELSETHPNHWVETTDNRTFCTPSCWHAGASHPPKDSSRLHGQMLVVPATQPSPNEQEAMQLHLARQQQNHFQQQNQRINEGR